MPADLHLDWSAHLWEGVERRKGEEKGREGRKKGRKERRTRMKESYKMLVKGERLKQGKSNRKEGGKIRGKANGVAQLI